MTAVSVLALALAVGGCGSSSDDDMGTGPTPAEIAAAAAKECTDAGGRVEANGSCTTVAAQIAEAAAAAATAKACTDGGGRPETDGSCTSAADVAEEVAMVCTAAGGRSNADGTCTPAADLMTEAVTAAAATKVTAIGEEAEQTAQNDGGLGGSADDGSPVGTYEFDIKYDSVKITDTANAEDDDPKFMQMRDLGDGRTMHVREMEADKDTGDVMDEVVIVTTDIKEPEAKPFADVHTLDTNNDDSNPPVAQSLTVDTANVGMWSSSDFPSAPNTTSEYAEDDATTDDMNEGAVMGMFNGAPGTFECASNDCSLDTDDKGKLETVVGTWHFTPSDGAMVDDPDADYLHYGFWLARTKDSDGNVKSYDEVETFAGSSIDESGSVRLVTGTASYEGGATGVYVNNVYMSDGSLDMATSGHFTADASLTATFGQVPVSDTDNTGTIAPDMLNTLTGTIDNFMLSGEGDNEWSVALSGDIVDFDGTASGTAKGGDGDGSFSATFHGPNEDADDDPIQPHSVVGEFNAGFVNGSVAGAFGARMPEEDE